MVFIRVKLEGKFAIGLLQILVGRCPAHPQDLVVIFTLLHPGGREAGKGQAARHSLGTQLACPTLRGQDAEWWQ